VTEYIKALRKLGQELINHAEALAQESAVDCDPITYEISQLALQLLRDRHRVMLAAVPRPAIVRVVEKSSPIMGEPRGTYLQVALPNYALKAFGKARPSFEKPFKLEPDVLVTSQEDVNRVWPTLCAKYQITVLEKE
jgi:hypothetical protein